MNQIHQGRENREDGVSFQVSEENAITSTQETTLLLVDALLEPKQKRHVFREILMSQFELSASIISDESCDILMSVFETAQELIDCIPSNNIRSLLRDILLFNLLTRIPFTLAQDDIRLLFKDENLLNFLRAFCSAVFYDNFKNFCTHYQVTSIKEISRLYGAQNVVSAFDQINQIKFQYLFFCKDIASFTKLLAKNHTYDVFQRVPVDTHIALFSAYSHGKKGSENMQRLYSDTYVCDMLMYTNHSTMLDLIKISKTISHLRNLCKDPHICKIAQLARPDNLHDFISKYNLDSKEKLKTIFQDTLIHDALSQDKNTFNVLIKEILCEVQHDIFLYLIALCPTLNALQELLKKERVLEIIYRVYYENFAYITDTYSINSPELFIDFAQNQSVQRIVQKSYHTTLTYILECYGVKDYHDFVDFCQQPDIYKLCEIRNTNVLQYIVEKYKIPNYQELLSLYSYNK